MEKSNKKRVALLVLTAVLLGTALGLLVSLILQGSCGEASPTVMLERAADAAIFRLELRESAQRFEELRLMEAEQRRQIWQEELSGRMEEYMESFTEDLLLLVNPWNGVPEDYQPRLTTVEEDYQVDRRCANALDQMLSDCREAGNLPVLCSAYRTYKYQEELFVNKILRVMANGIYYGEAEVIAARSVARPGTSEHHLGLAVDIIDETYVNLDKWQEYTAVQQWLMANCTRYGFILRYPNGKSDVTGIIYEPWHYRYVGPEMAQSIAESGLCLEEYLEAQQDNT